jgi:hypothetical protein
MLRNMFFFTSGKKSTKANYKGAINLTSKNLDMINLRIILERCLGLTKKRMARDSLIKELSH